MADVWNNENVGALQRKNICGWVRLWGKTFEAAMRVLTTTKFPYFRAKKLENVALLENEGSLSWR